MRWPLIDEEDMDVADLSGLEVKSESPALAGFHHLSSVGEKRGGRLEANRSYS
jgi:hypothetical protein